MQITNVLICITHSKGTQNNHTMIRRNKIENITKQHNVKIHNGPRLADTLKLNCCLRNHSLISDLCRLTICEMCNMPFIFAPVTFPISGTVVNTFPLENCPYIDHIITGVDIQLEQSA